MKQNKISRRELLISIAIALIFGLSFGIGGRFIEDAPIVTSILFASYLIYLLANNSKHKVLVKSIAAFVVVHLVIFPFIYLGIIRSDMSSFEVDELIVLNETQNALWDADEKFKFKESATNLYLTKEVYELQNPELDLPLSHLNEGNIVVDDSFMVHGSTVRKSTGKSYFEQIEMTITDSDGKLLGTLKCDSRNERLEYDIDTLSIRDVLWIKINTYAISAVNYTKARKDIIDSKNFWSYKRFVWYSISILNTDNLKPRSRLANVAYWIHYLIVNGYLLALILTILIELRKPKGDRTE